MPSSQGFGAPESTGKPLGAYGLRFRGLDAAVEADLSPVAPDAPEVDVQVRLALDVAAFEEVGDDHVSFAHARGPRYDFHRQPATALLSLPQPPDPRALVHPLLTLVGGVFGRWRRALTLHGGAFVVGGAAWAVVAEKDGGKSTTLAGVADAGAAVLADDLVVVERGEALAGPRSVDLRPGAAQQLERGEHIGFVGGRHRHRVHLPEPPASAPLAGVVVLAWDDAAPPKMSSLDVAERLRLLHVHLAWSVMGPPDAERMMDLVGLPVLRLARPRRWEVHDEVVQLLTGLG